MKSLILSNNLINGQRKLSDWADVNWQKAYKIVRNLRKRIFRAKKCGQFKRLRNLQKLMIRSYANLLLAIRQITQINDEKRTAGVDRRVINTPSQRVKLANEWIMPSALPAKRTYTPKANDKKRPLGIPTIMDRVAQAIVKNALEPEWEAVFEPNSYGFRPGRSCLDAIEQNFIRLQGRRDTWVLDAEIKGFFDNRAHETILEEVGTFPARKLISGWLKLGLFEEGKLNPTETGTPQGGDISPLLANIGLHGLEEYIKKVNPKLGIIRYADDFLITARDRESLEKVLIELKQWLSQRGLEISEEKTRIVHIDEGFNFLGFNHRYYDGKLLVKPQKEKVLKFCTRLGEEIQKLHGQSAEAVIRKLNPILKGFANYYKTGVSKETFSYISHRLFQYIWRWCCRNHPHKSKTWVKKKYFQKVDGRNWVFMTEVPTRTDGIKYIALYNIADAETRRRTALVPPHQAADIQIEGHIKVAGKNSPDDPKLTEYWENQGSKYYQVANSQDWKCGICKQFLLNGEELETHHQVPVHKGCSDDGKNKRALTQSVSQAGT